MTKKERRAQVVAESNRTGKSFEDLMFEKNPERYKQFVAKQLHDGIRAFQIIHNRRAARAAKVIAETRGRADAELDATHRRLCLSIAKTIELDELYERRWDKIKEGLIAEGAPRRITEI